MRRLSIRSLGLIAIVAAACTSAGVERVASGLAGRPPASAGRGLGRLRRVAPSATPDACAAENLTRRHPRQR